MTQHELDLEVAANLEDFKDHLSSLADIRRKLTDVELINIKSYLDYAIATLRSTNNE